MRRQRPGMTVAPACAVGAAAVAIGLLVPAVPDSSELWSTLLLERYNTRVVVLGVTMLGLACGAVGSFLLLRRRSLTTDALSHATLPGIALAFILAAAVGVEGKSTWVLVLGALVTGSLGILVVQAITATTRLKEDAALGIVLSVFFGLGVSLLKIAEYMPGGSAAGLNSFILGHAASMIAADLRAIVWVSVASLLLCVLLFKEWRLLCFDSEFARVQGWPVTALDLALMGVIVALTVVGLRAVGLVLIVALLITPAVAARFWTRRLAPMTAVAALLGAVCGYSGAVASALAPRMPTGPIIVIMCGAALGVSLIAGAESGLARRWLHIVANRRRVAQQHLLRALYEAHEIAGEAAPQPTPLTSLLELRSWSRRGLRSAIRRAQREGLAVLNREDTVTLTKAGWSAAARLVRNHRLWEQYLVSFADIAPSHVDRNADEIEHVLGAELTARLEALLAADGKRAAPPPSPHALATGTGSQEQGR